MTPIALSIAGSPKCKYRHSGRPQEFAVLGVHGATVITVLPAQNTREVTVIEPVRAAMVLVQIDDVFADLRVVYP
jgi:hypothetical protein